MFQILGQALLIATRQETGAPKTQRHNDHPQTLETPRSRWFQLGGERS